MKKGVRKKSSRESAKNSKNTSFSRKARAALGLLTVVFVFLFVSYFVNENVDFLQEHVSDGPVSMVVYFLLISLEVILAPTSLIPIIPVAAALWGPGLAFILTMIGWTIGSVVAFLLAQQVGVPLLEKLTSVEEMDRFQKFIPEKNLFLGVVVIRLFIPFDIMSYAIGFFTDIDLKRYTLATIIGFIPGTFMLAYFGGVPMQVKMVMIGIGVVIILAMILFKEKLNKLFVKLFKV